MECSGDGVAFREAYGDITMAQLQIRSECGIAFLLMIFGAALSSLIHHWCILSRTESPG